MKRLTIALIMAVLLVIPAAADTLTLTLAGGDVGLVTCSGERIAIKREGRLQVRVECIGGAATPTATSTGEPPTATATATATSTPTVAMTGTPTPTSTLALPTDTPAPTSTPGAPTGRLSGILAVPSSGYDEAFRTIAAWGGNATSLQGPVSAAELEAAVDAARAAGLGLVGRASSGSFIVGGHIDTGRLTDLIHNQFDGNDLAEQLTGYYLIDEPCHPKNAITVQEMRDFYATIKALQPGLRVLVNFSYAACLEEMTSLGQTADIAAVCRNVTRPAGYWQEQAATVAKVKERYPDLVVLAWSAVYEYPARGVPIPSAEWVRTTGMEAASYDAFDGVMYFSWAPSSYMGDTIEDVAGDLAYASAFSDVFILVGK